MDTLTLAEAERKIRWLRGMLRWAVRLAVEYRARWQWWEEDSIYHAELLQEMEAEVEALRQAGRGLFEAYKSLCLEDGRASMRFDAIDAWRKVDPQ